MHFVTRATRQSLQYLLKWRHRDNWLYHTSSRDIVKDRPHEAKRAMQTPNEDCTLITAQTHTQHSNTMADMQSHTLSLLRGGDKKAWMNCWQWWQSKKQRDKIRPSGEERDAEDEMLDWWKMCLCYWRAWEERQNDIPRHVRIKKLAVKAKHNVPLVDWREKNVRFHIYSDVSFCRTEQRPDRTKAWPRAQPSNPIPGH